MSLGQALGLAGAIVGNIIAPGIGGAIGFMAGTLIGNLLDPPKIEGPKLQDLKLQTSEYGRPIPIIYGTMRVSGNVIWQTDLIESQHTEGGKGGPEVTSYTYSASFAVLLCEGPIASIVEVFADGRKVWPTGDDSAFDFTLYTGTETQTPDPTMEAEIGAGMVPAHRGYAYVVFDNLQLSDFGNRIPQMEFVIATIAAPSEFTVIKENDDTGSDSYTYPVILDWPFNGQPVVSHLTVQSAFVTDPVSGHYYDADTLAMGSAIGVAAGYAWPNYHGTQQRVGIGKHVYADGTSVYLWAREGGTVTAFNYLRDATGAINYVELAGVPGSLYAVGCATSQDETILFVFLNSTSISDPPDEWYKIVDGVVADNGTINPPLSQLSNVRGRQSYQLGATGSASAENNGRYIWFFAYNDKTAEIYYIDDSNNLADWGGGTLAIPTLPNSSLASPNWNVGCQTLAQEGYCGVASGEGLALLRRVGAAGQITLSQIVSDISSRTPLAVSEYDTTDLTDLVPGYMVGGQMEARNAIQPLRQAYFFDAVEVDGVVTFVKRGGASAVTVDDDDLAARPEGDDAPALVSVVRTQEAELPKRVYVEYINADFDYQIGTQYDERQVTSSETATTLSLPISLSDQTARFIAGAHVWGAYQEREVFTWWTSRKYAKYVPTDVMTVQGMTLRVLTAQEGANQTIQWTGVVSRAELYDVPASLVGVGSSSPGQVAPAANVRTEAVLLDIPNLSQDDAPFGFYAALGPQQDGSWPGATLFKSVDGGSTYKPILSVNVPSIIGVVTEALGAADGSPTSVLTVTLTDDDATLSSCNATALANGANMFALESGSGWEFCQFMTATYVSPKVYQITVDTRGQRDTTAYQSGHAAGDTFVLLSTVYNVDAPESELNVALWYKAVTFGNNLASATAFQFTNTGVGTGTFYETELDHLAVFIGDNSGSPTIAPRKGLVPAPAVGDGALEAVLMATNDSGSYWGVPSWAGGSGSPAAGGAITVKDEGVTLTTAASTLDFVGAGVTATYASGTVTITIPGGGATAGSPSIAGTYGGTFAIPVITVNDYGFVTAITTTPTVGRIQTLDEGASVDATAIALNFVGGGVVATDAGAGVTQVSVPLKAPVDATYLVREVHADLTNECVLVAGAGITITESGGSPPASLTIASSVGNGATSQSQEFTTAGAFTCYIPASVTAVRITAIGAGGGGSTRASALGGAGGGSGEQIMSFVAYFAGGSPNTVTGVVGAKGTGAASGGGSAAGNPGGDTIIYVSGATITARGGLGGTNAGVGGAGGGFRGGAGGGSANPGGAGTAGTAEAVTHFGGGGGGGGGSTTGANGGLGAPSGGYDSPTRANAASTQGGGGGGADSPWGLGGAGGGGGSAGNNAAATSYGAGGGGAGGLTGSTAAGGNGCDGYVIIEYVAAP